MSLIGFGELRKFSVQWQVDITAVDEFVAEPIAALTQTPRAREVYNLWFVATKLRDHLNAKRISDLAQKIVQEKNVPVSDANGIFDPKHLATLERACDNGLREVCERPAWVQAEHDLTDALRFTFVN